MFASTSDRFIFSLKYHTVLYICACRLKRKKCIWIFLLFQEISQITLKIGISKLYVVWEITKRWLTIHSFSPNSIVFKERKLAYRSVIANRQLSSSAFSWWKSAPYRLSPNESETALGYSSPLWTSDSSGRQQASSKRFVFKNNFFFLVMSHELLYQSNLLKSLIGRMHETKKRKIATPPLPTLV